MLPTSKKIENNIPYESWSDLVRNPIILNMIKEEILDLTKEVSEYSRPKKFVISCKEFGAGEGYVTPSYKFKRKKLFMDFLNVLDELYENDDEFFIMQDRLTGFDDQSMIIG